MVLGYDVNGIKDILGIWIGEAEGKHYWMQIFDEIKVRGVEDILFISMDGVSGLEAVDVWVRNWSHVEQLFHYGSAVRKVMYTTNAIESVDPSTCKLGYGKEPAFHRR